MIVNPAIIGLTTCSLLVSIIMIYASVIGIKIIKGWDIRSGSEKQLILERKTYLVSTVLNYVMICELFSLFLFISTADHIHTLFIGAMCAAGTLYAADYGYLTLILKAMSFILCGIWIIVNHVDNKGFDYPLVKFKYKFLLVITLLIIIETILQSQYLTGLDPEIITSCCGVLFSDDMESIAGEIAHLPSLGTKIAFYSGLLFTLGAGIRAYITGKGVGLFSFLSIGFLFLSVAAIISFISLYFYELPTHHCPFCLLQKEYHYIGYPLYLSLFIATITGGGSGMIHRFKEVLSLKEIVPAIQKRLCLASMISYIVFAVIATYPIIFSDFKLEGY